MTEPLRICEDTSNMLAMPYALRQFVVVVSGTTLDALHIANEEYRRQEQERLDAQKEDTAEDDPIWEDALHWLQRAKPKMDGPSLPLVEGLLKNDDKISVL